MTELRESTISKPKTHKGKRVVEKRESKIIEDPKTAVLIRTTTTSQDGLQILRDLYSLKKPDAVLLAKKNDVKPFEVNGEGPLEFLVRRNEGSLFAVSSHSKKRPNNLVLGRTFDDHILDMMELGIESHQPLGFNKHLTGTRSSISACTTPLVIFQGEIFETAPEYSRLKNLLLDFFGMPASSVDSVRLPGIEHVISFTAHSTDSASTTNPKILMKSFKINLKKSGTRYPRAELEPLGPDFTFSLRRTQVASDDHWKKATKQVLDGPKKENRNKNKGRDVFGRVMGRVHMNRQNYGKLQTRKVRALKMSNTERKSALKNRLAALKQLAGGKGLRGPGGAGGKRPGPDIFRITPAQNIKFDG